MNSKETKPTVDIKDYLLDASPGEYVKASSPYEVLLQTASDFIISRKKAKSERELVILISESLFYFKEKDKVEEVTPEKLRAFLRDLRGDDFIALDNVRWLPKLNKNSISRLIDIITNDIYIEMCKANVLTDYNNLYWCTDYWSKNPELFIQVHSSISSIIQYSYRALMVTAFEIENRYGIDEALYFTEVLKKTSIEQYTSSADRYYCDKELSGFFAMLEERYNLNLRRLIDYIFMDAFSQGIKAIDTYFWKAYQEYLTLQIKAFGEITDKYPAYLMTARNVMALNTALIERASAFEPFSERAAEVSRLAHDGKEYSVIVPESVRDIADEGIALGHCMGSDSGKISSGDMYILFLRNSSTKEEPLVTLRYSDGRITGAEGLHRRGLTDDERKFLKNWGKEKNVQIAA